jgi:hypothetical protein
MTWYGWKGGWPLQWGGGPTDIELINEGLRSSVGKGHMADSDGIEWRWRECRALGLSLVMTMAERGLNQFDPGKATDALSFYRELFRLPSNMADQSAREAADLLYHKKPELDVPSILDELRRIDQRFSILERPWAETTTTMHGRAFEDWDRENPFALFPNQRGDSYVPNYSNAFDLVVLFDTGTDPPVGNIENAALTAARAYLDDALPSWMNYTIAGSVGIILDVTPLDWGYFDA